MKIQALNEVAKIHGGGRLRLSGNDFVDAGIPAYGAAGLNGRVNQAEYSAQTAVILSSIGARCGKCFFVSGAWTSLANTQVIIPLEQLVDAKFLWYQLNDEGRWHRSGSAQPFIKPSDVKSHSVWVPPLEEQRRIAAILDQADALRAKRRQVLAWLDELERSIFQDMFAFETSHTTVSDIAAQTRTGPFGSQLLHGEFVESGVAVLGLDNVVGNRFRWAERRYITPAKYQQLQRYTVHPGDVLISIMGTTGRCVVVPDDIPVAINTKHICAITVDREQIDPQFLRAAFLWDPRTRAYLRKQTKGAIMDGLNMGIIRAMPVPLPTPARQLEFNRRLESIESLRVKYEGALAADEHLFATLRAQAFRGEL